MASARSSESSARLIGMLHTHTHPPSLIPPAPPIPLPSIGMLVGSGSMAVLGCGLPLARAGDIGISVTCGSLAPPFEVFTGSSNVFVGGARAARILDITKHCDPTAMGPFGIAMAAAGVVAGAAGAIATGQAAAAAQAAADAAVLALKLLCGKDPGLPPGIGALVGPPCPTVMIGGFPCPPIGDMAIGALMKGLKKLAAAAKKLRPSRRGNGHCADGSHPIYLVTGENFDEFTDFVSPGLFRWKRHYTTARAAIDGPLGFGFRHFYQRHLDVRLHKTTFIDWDGVEFEFPQFRADGDVLSEHGYVLRRVRQTLGDSVYELSTRDQPTMIFAGDRFDEVLPLVGMRDERRELGFEYDRHGRLVAVVDSARDSAAMERYQLSYDHRGRIVAIHELGSPPTARFACTYTPAGELHRVRDACNGLWSHEYDAGHRWTRQIDPRGYGYSFRYDDRGRCVWACGDDGLWEASVEYFPDKGFTRYVEGEGAVREYHYDADGFITKIVDPEGRVRERKRDSSGRILAEIDVGGRTLHWLYDGAGVNCGRRDHLGYLQPTELDRPARVDPRKVRLATTVRGWWFGPIRSSAAAMFGLDPRMLERLPAPLHDLARSVFHLRPLDAPSRPPSPREQYDALGRKVREVDAHGRTREWVYDETGNVIAIRDRDGKVSRQVTTSWNLLGCRIDPLGNVCKYGWTSLEQRKAFVDPAGNTANWAYDRCERLTTTWRNQEIRERYVYDGADRLVEKRDGEGRLIFRNAEFHASDLVARRELADGGALLFDYDERGRPTSVSTDAHNVEIAYDPFGRRVAERRDGVGIEHDYTRTGEVRVRVLERFELIRARAHGSLHLRDAAGVVSRLTLVDAIVERRCGNGTVEWQQHDEDGRLLARLSWRHGESGRLDRHAVRYVYSAEGELLSESDSRRGLTRYTYDDAHRLIGEVRPDGEALVYEYDAADNLVRRPGLSRLAVAAGNLATGTATERFEHDERARMSARHHRDGGVTRYYYDSLDMLVRVERIDAAGRRLADWTAAYDAKARCLWTRCGDVEREFYWDGDRIVAELEGQALRIYQYANDEALIPSSFVDYPSREAEAAAGRSFDVHCNASGMPTRIEDRDGRIVWWADRVDPHGLVELHPGSTIHYNLRWPGHYFIPELGLHYNRHRYYDPSLGRYLQSDPIGYRGSPINLYAYCTNPLVNVDVLGLTHPHRGSSDDGDGRSRLMSEAEAEAVARRAAEEYRQQIDAAIKNGEPIDIGGGRMRRLDDKSAGPVVVVVVDRRTGQVSRAINDPGKQPPRNLHPAMEGRVNWSQENRRHGSRPATHGEAWATNDALHARDAHNRQSDPNAPRATQSDIDEMTVLPVWRQGDSDRMRAGEPAARCGNCEVITDGAHAPGDANRTFDHKMRGQQRTPAADAWEPGDRPWDD